jgi:hypothetical protein
MADVAFTIARTNQLRLRIGRPGRLTSALERVDELWSRLLCSVVRLLLRLLTSTRSGRLIELAVEELRPGLAARFLETDSR